MSKIGVGVGEDFPVDDGPGKPGNSEQDDRAEYEEWRRRRAEWRASREQWRAHRDEWRARREEWRAKRRAFKQKVRDAARESFGPEWESYRRARRGYYRHWHFPFGILMPVLGIVLFFSLLSAIFKAPFFFLGLAALGYFFFVHRHHHHSFEGCDYDFDAKPASGPAPKPEAKPTPPPPSAEAS